MTDIVFVVDEPPYGYNTMTCTACQGAGRSCHECKGVGNITHIRIPSNCNASLPNCPVSYDPMCGGWECSRCGRSGPA